MVRGLKAIRAKPIYTCQSNNIKHMPAPFNAAHALEIYGHPAALRDLEFYLSDLGIKARSELCAYYSERISHYLAQGLTREKAREKALIDAYDKFREGMPESCKRLPGFLNGPGLIGEAGPVEGAPGAGPQHASAAAAALA